MADAINAAMGAVMSETTSGMAARTIDHGARPWQTWTLVAERGHDRPWPRSWTPMILYVLADGE